MRKNAQSKLLRDKAYEKIKKSIIMGNYDSASVLYESTLSKELGMSRTPVREALMRLGEDGLVNNLPNNGFLVIVPTLKEIDEIFDLRICLEKFVIEEIFSKEIEYSTDKLNEIVVQQKNALKKNDFWKFFERNQEFHIELVKLAQNGTLAKVMRNLREKPIQSGFLALKKNARLQDAIEEHLSIIEALNTRDRDRVIVEITRHVNNARKRLLGYNPS